MLRKNRLSCVCVIFIFLVSLSFINCGGGSGTTSSSGDGGSGDSPSVLEIVSHSPNDAQSDVYLNKEVRVLFSEALLADQEPDAIVVTDSNGDPADGKIQLYEKNLTFIPSRWKQEESYTVTVSSEVCCSSGVLGEDYTFSFTTGLTKSDGTEPPSDDFNPLGKGDVLVLGKKPEMFVLWDKADNDYAALEDFNLTYNWLVSVSRQAYSSLEREKRVVVGQFDNDGWDEVAVFTRMSGQDQTPSLIIFDTYDVEEQLEISVPLSIQPVDFMDAAAADLDGDGRDEIVLLTGSKANGGLGLRIFKWNTQSGSYDTETEEWIGGDPEYEVVATKGDTSLGGLTTSQAEYGKVAAGDIDDDGMAEVVILYHRAYVTESSPGVYTENYSNAWYAVYDDLEAGLAEIVITSHIPGGEEYGRMSWGGRYVPLVDPPQPVSLQTSFCFDPYIEVEVGDIDGDGVQEILFGITEPEFTHIWIPFLGGPNDAENVKCMVKDSLKVVDYLEFMATDPGASDRPDVINATAEPYDLYPQYNEAAGSESVWFPLVDTEQPGYSGPKSGNRKFFVKGSPTQLLLTGDLNGDLKDDVLFHNRIYVFNIVGTKSDAPSLATDSPGTISSELISLVAPWKKGAGWWEPFHMADDFDFMLDDASKDDSALKDAYAIGDIDGDNNDEIVQLRIRNPDVYGDEEDVDVWTLKCCFLDEFDKEICCTDPEESTETALFEATRIFPDWWQRGDHYQVPGEPLIVLPNIDDDSMIVEKMGHDTYIGDSVVVAVIAAPPCSEDLGQNPEDCTSAFTLGSSQGEGEGTYLDWHANAVAGTEMSVSAFDIDVFSYSIELVRGAEGGKELINGYTTSEAIGYTVEGGTDNYVIFDAYTYDRYYYKVLTAADPDEEGKTVTINVPTDSRRMFRTLSFYNANNGDQMDIDDSIIGVVAGDLSTYPSQTEANSILGEPENESIGINSTPINPTGIQTIELASEVWEQESYKDGDYHEVTANVCGGAGGLLCLGLDIGGSTGNAHEYSWSEETVLEGTITEMSPGSAMDYETGIFAYRTELSTPSPGDPSEAEEIQKFVVFNYYLNWK